MTQQHKWNDTPFKNPLARAKGLGSAHDGLHHWMGQKITALANIPLVIWGVWSAVSIAATGGSQPDVLGFFAQPFNAVMMILFVVSVFYHMALGLQVVIEDYVHSRCKTPLLIVIKLGVFVLATVSIFSILKMAFAV